MADYNMSVDEQDSNILQPSEKGDSTPDTNNHEPKDHFAVFLGKLLDQGDTLIYAIVGTCFLLGSLFILGYSIWDFAITIAQISTIQTAEKPSAIVDATTTLISNLLLVLIITEILGTIIHYLKVHTTSLRPFLFIGIISATRGILTISAKLAIGHTDNFNNTMIELGVHAAVVLVFGITLKLIGNMSEIGSDS